MKRIAIAVAANMGGDSAAYACRYLAKNVVAAGLARKCTIQISYAIGVSHPLSVYVDLQGTGHDVDEAKLERVLQELMNRLGPFDARVIGTDVSAAALETAREGRYSGRTVDLARQGALVEKKRRPKRALWRSRPEGSFLPIGRANAPAPRALANHEGTPCG